MKVRPNDAQAVEKRRFSDDEIARDPKLTMRLAFDEASAHHGIDALTAAIDAIANGADAMNLGMGLGGLFASGTAFDLVTETTGAENVIVRLCPSLGLRSVLRDAGIDWLSVFEAFGCDPINPPRRASESPLGFATPTVDDSGRA